MITASQNVFGVDSLMSTMKPANAYVENARRNIATVVSRFSGEIEILKAVIRKVERALEFIGLLGETVGQQLSHLKSLLFLHSMFGHEFCEKPTVDSPR